MTKQRFVTVNGQTWTVQPGNDTGDTVFLFMGGGPGSLADHRLPYNEARAFGAALVDVADEHDRLTGERTMAQTPTEIEIPIKARVEYEFPPERIVTMRVDREGGSSLEVVIRRPEHTNVPEEADVDGAYQAVAAGTFEVEPEAADDTTSVPETEALKARLNSLAHDPATCRMPAHFHPERGDQLITPTNGSDSCDCGPNDACSLERCRGGLKDNADATGVPSVAFNLYRADAPYAEPVPSPGAAPYGDAPTYDGRTVAEADPQMADAAAMLDKPAPYEGQVDSAGFPVPGMRNTPMTCEAYRIEPGGVDTRTGGMRYGYRCMRKRCRGSSDAHSGANAFATAVSALVDGWVAHVAREHG